MSHPSGRARFCEKLRVRYADTDAQGHVFFANYLTFFDEAFTGYCSALGRPWSELLGSGVDAVYRKSSCEHLGRSVFGDVLEIDARPLKVGNTSLTMGFVARRDQGRELVARGELTLVFLDAALSAKVRVPAALRAAMRDFEPEPVPGLEQEP